MRNALGMSVSQLAKRLNITQSSASGLEKREKEGRLTLKKLKEMANAMDCDLIYAFVPRDSLEKTIHDQARKKSREKHGISRNSHGIRRSKSDS